MKNVVFFENLVGDMERYIEGKIYRLKVEVKRKVSSAFFLTNILLLNDFVYLISVG